MRSRPTTVPSAQRSAASTLARSPFFEKVLEVLPAHVDARRNLAMSHLESGDKETAKDPVCEMEVEPEKAFATRTVELMPDKAGELEFRCHMGILRGELIVEWDRR